MGSASSKFKKYVQHGDEFAAMQIFQSTPELRKNLDPNISYGDSHHHNTALHYAAKHGMKHLLRTFLNDLGGNPNKKNGCNETSLHCACQLTQKSFSAEERRAACVTLLLQWRGVPLNSGGREKIDLQAQDQKGDTALHCAAVSGMERCVELLLAHGAPLFLENHDRLTPCDAAVRSDHHGIAQLLESRMVFADAGDDTVNEAELYGPEGPEEVYSGLRTQDLQEAKDQLLVETSDMLHVPLFTAEALLRDNEWSRETLLEKWMKDPVQCCQLAGVQPPASALQHRGSPRPPRAALLEDSRPRQDPVGPEGGRASDICEICMLAMPCWDRPVSMSCSHQFCTSCWENYLTVKIQDGDAHHILCPAYQCHILVPVEVIERLVSPDMARRYLQFDIKAFVESNRSIKWCPMPGCGRAVRLPETEQAQPGDALHGIPTARPPPLTSHAVDCGNSHFFCWECLGEAHAPCGCAQWQQWQHKISEVKPEELRASCVETEDAANCLWLVTNSKPCPNCKSPIQKNEGCNHMKCSKCKFDFCWVCLENWKKHSSATGGYFRCNRFEAVHKADEKQGMLISEAVQRNQQMQELNRFLHYYTRFRNHENSQKLEEPLLNNARKKMELLASSFCRTNKGEDNTDKGTKFVEDSIRELLKARRVLCGSYVYGYYLEDNGYNKTIFEFMQVNRCLWLVTNSKPCPNCKSLIRTNEGCNHMKCSKNELEEVTEKLSEMVARPYLRTPRPVIVQTTALARRKRHEFVRAVSKGLIPPETPPTLRKVRKRRFPGLVGLDPVDDEQISHAIAASLKDLDSNNPWVKDAQGCHTNLSALYDWPDNDSDEEESEVNRALAVSLVGECSRAGCARPRARNPRTSAVHDYCSLRCSRSARAGAGDDVYRVNVTADYNMDLVIALEMSRLQMIEDEMKKRQRAEEAGKEQSSAAPAPGVGVLDDQQLKLAIQLSLQESTKRVALLQSSLAAGSLSDQEPPGDSGSSAYHRTSADLTVDYFLKSLAGRQLGGGGVNVFSPEEAGRAVWGCGLSKTLADKEPIGFEDGRFQIGDLHENGRFNDPGDYEEGDAHLLRRSHSTGDLCTRGRQGRGEGAAGGDESRYHLDSDHSSQHEEKPEDVVKRLLALPASGRGMTGRQFMLLHHNSGGSNSNAGGELSTTTSEDGASLYFGGQSSIEDTTTTSDSLNADLEVCGILGTTTEDEEEGRSLVDDDLIAARSVKTFPPVFHKSALAINDTKNYNFGQGKTKQAHKDGHVQNDQAANGASVAVSSHVSGSEKSTFSNSLLEAHRKAFKAAGGKAPGSGGLRIRICKSPNCGSGDGTKHRCRRLETDSSNEYESETGIPKSPTLYISGVSISRTPEPRSPAVVAGRQSRSSSLTVPPPAPSPPGTPAATPPPLASRPASPAPAPAATKAKSASEPEREREMFRFPKSSTDGALSSVLHVQESNLSSDDFHEALFLLERSPKGGSRRRKRSKKERHKDKENSGGGKEASSAL